MYFFFKYGTKIFREMILTIRGEPIWKICAILLYVTNLSCMESSIRTDRPGYEWIIHTNIQNVTCAIVILSNSLVVFPVPLLIH